MQMMYDVSMDSATDAVLQQVIRKEISSSTVITVAHRVPTVTDSNMIEVLLGKIEKFDDLMVAVAAKGRHLETIKHDGKP